MKKCILYSSAWLIFTKSYFNHHNVKNIFPIHPNACTAKDTQCNEGWEAYLIPPDEPTAPVAFVQSLVAKVHICG
jgi:hypothetical protein